MNESLLTSLKQLRLSGLALSLDVRLQEAAGNSLTHAEFLELILQDELLIRNERLHLLASNSETLVAQDLVAHAAVHCRNHLLSDLLVATELLGGALQGAFHIAAANLPLIKTTTRRKEWVARLSQASHQGLEATLRVRSQLLAKAHAALNSG